jgi:hypothetical protein
MGGVATLLNVWESVSAGLSASKTEVDWLVPVSAMSTGRSCGRDARSVRVLATSEILGVAR